MELWDMPVSIEGLALAAASFSAFAAIVSTGLSFSALRSQRRHQRLSVKPSLKISVDNYEDRLAVSLKNEGLGPAIVKRLICSKTNSADATNNLIDLMPDITRPWSTFMQISPDFVLAPHTEATLIAIEIDTDDPEDTALREDLRSELSQILINCHYTDFYGSRLPPATRKLTYFTTFRND